MLESLYTFTDDIRNRFDEFEAKANEVSSASDYISVVARARKRTRCFDEVQETATVVLEDKLTRIPKYLKLSRSLKI